MSTNGYITLPLPNGCSVERDPYGLASLAIPADEATNLANALHALAEQEGRNEHG